jgi:hypothetical protein
MNLCATYENKPTIHSFTLVEGKVRCFRKLQPVIALSCALRTCELQAFQMRKKWPPKHRLQTLPVLTGALLLPRFVQLTVDEVIAAMHKAGIPHTRFERFSYVSPPGPNRSQATFPPALRTWEMILSVAPSAPSHPPPALAVVSVCVNKDHQLTPPLALAVISV